MKKIVLIVIILFAASAVFAQKKQTEKPPTQKEMEEMMKEAQKMMGELSEDDKKMMDSLGIKMPDFKNPPKVSDRQLAKAREDEDRVVPKRDAARVASIPKAVTDARMETYIAAIQKKIMETLDAALVKMGDQIYSYIQSNSKSSHEAGNMAAAFWLTGKPKMALYVLGKVCTDAPANIDNLSNYAAMLSMQGGEHLAIPILNNLNAKFPKNSTLLNNLGQAWLGLGELIKAEKYLDSAIALYAFHPQANMAKAAIAESKGNIEKAKDAVKKSIQHAYTEEKEEKLAKLGEKLSHTQYILPPRRKTDGLNLDGFRSPYFPMSSPGCIHAEIEWKSFYEQVDEKINSLSRLKKDAEDAAMKGQQQRMIENVAYIKSAQANPGANGQMLVVPIYATRATKKLKASMHLAQRKIEAYSSRLNLYAQESLQLKKAYDEQMKKLRKEDENQTGSHRANEAYCPKYKAVTDKYLKDINGRLQALYLDALTLKKEMINESAHYTMYMMWPDEFQVAKLNYQIEWLSFLKKGFGAPAYGSGFPFVSITLNEYSCNTDTDEEPELTRLQNFDDVHCEYNSETDLGVVKFSSNCSRLTSTFNIKFLQYTRTDDFERAEGDTYISSTIKISAEKGLGDKIEKGPLKVEAKIGAAIEIEMNRRGVKDVKLTGEVKVGAGFNVNDKGMEEHGSIAGKDVHDMTIEAGIEASISIISGQGSVYGTGALKGITVTNF
ncbi:MAG: hypothetical protein KF746_16190 [Chitinophagaceae bacterium]|nr:hypothetical protein [Chitinophagaceae bacterium]